MENEGAKATGSSVSLSIHDEVVNSGVNLIHPDRELISSINGTPMETRGEIIEHPTQPSNIIDFTNAKEAMNTQEGETKRSTNRWKRLWFFREKEQKEKKDAA